MNTQARENLRTITDFKSLVDYLRDELDWPIEETDFEDLTFDYGPEELGIDEKNAAKIDPPIKQLRPLSSSQPWGIFFVKFEPKRLPVVALRRILSRLVLKKRSGAKYAEQASWQLHDLLFILNFGEAEQRQITFAHFSENPGTGDLPTLQVLGWDAGDTALHLDHVDAELHHKMRWPDDETDLGTWRERWSAAFTLRHREVITTSKKLAVELAKIAQRIRRCVNAVLEIEDENGAVRKLMASFKEALIHDLSEDDFADMYAQTISYGLLSARVSRPAGLVADDVVHMVPVTNPFLKELLETFLHVSGRKKFLDFDELGVNEVVQLLREANMEAVLRDFGDANPQEDPVIHFYELFLKEYDAKKRMQRGVFYTPRPVVSFIVRSVDEILRTEFDLPDGLADTTTWGEMARRHKELQIPKGADPDQCFVQILDPATGTGTFLVEVIDLIYKTLTAKWQKQGKTAAETEQLWNEYVPKYLLPRLHGYELLMAPYAIAHMKIGLKLAETGYRFGSDERVRVYLTNALEPPTEIGQLDLLSKALAHEAKAVNTVKEYRRFTVVIGNPPYAGISSNNSEHAVRLVDAYKIVDGKALKEKKLWLQDDYVKFIRFAQLLLYETGLGILGLISNHGFLDNPTFRGMRQSLMESFCWLHVLDLHGNANKGERGPDGSAEQNVFEIRQGVAITIATASLQCYGATVNHFEVWGIRSGKYQWLEANSTVTTPWSCLSPVRPYRFFVPRNQDVLNEYEKFFPLEKVVRDRTVGMITARDSLTIHFTQVELSETVRRFAELSTEEARIRFGLGKDARDWSVVRAQEDLRNHGLDQKYYREVLYRPFDFRITFYTGTSRGFIGQPQKRIMAHLDGKMNWALCISRFNRQKSLGYFFATKTLTDFHLLDTVADSMTVFPLYLNLDRGDQNELSLDGGVIPNFAPEFLDTITRRFGVRRLPDSGLPKAFSPSAIFHYIYAIFYSPNYRRCYAEFLKIDFPRIPLTSSLELFRALAKLGGELVALHLMESPRLENFITTLVAPNLPANLANAQPCEGSKPSQGFNPETAEFRVEKVSYADETVWLDKAQTYGFRGVPAASSRQRTSPTTRKSWLRSRRSSA